MIKKIFLSALVFILISGQSFAFVNNDYPFLYLEKYENLKIKGDIIDEAENILKTKPDIENLFQTWSTIFIKNEEYENLIGDLFWLVKDKNGNDLTKDQIKLFLTKKDASFLLHKVFYENEWWIQKLIFDKLSGILIDSKTNTWIISDIFLKDNSFLFNGLNISNNEIDSYEILKKNHNLIFWWLWLFS